MRKIVLHATGLSVSFAALMIGAAPAIAQATAPASNDAADIVVTAQKRPEKLQQIPVAAAVLSADAVAQAHVTDLSDINRVVPSVEIKGTFNGRVPYGIRGISTNADEGTVGLTSGVNIQVDGVPVPADSFAANTITDVSQLEVLKGPQATLGGRTASAGVINFVTFGPTRDTHFAFDTTLTNDGEHRVDVRASGPISDGLSYSLAGYYNDTPYPVYNITLAQRTKAQSEGIRGKLKWDVTSDLDVTLMGHYALSTSSGENFVPQYFTPGAFFFAPPVGLTQSVVFPGYNIYYGNTAYASHTPMGSRYEDKDGSLEINYRLGGATLTSTTSLFRENQSSTQDVFETNDPNFALQFTGFLNAIGVLPAALVQPFNNTQAISGYVNQTTQELKLASDASKNFSYIIGGFYSSTTVNNSEYREFTLNPLSKDVISTTKSYAIYGRATEKLSDLISVVGGLRYNWDKIGWNVNEFFNPAAGIFGNGGFGQGGFDWNLHDNSSALVGDFALQLHPSRNVMAYASYTRGYKPKAFNTGHNFAAPQSAPAAADLPFTNATAQEHINSFELGMKSSLLDRHVTFNIDAFYTKYNGYQAQVFNTLTGLIALLELSNADARTEGVEADLTYARGNTRAMLSGAYIDAKFTNFPGAACFPSQSVAQGCTVNATGSFVQNLSGASLPDSPKVKLTASITQTVPLEKFNLILGGNLSYRSAALFQADQNPETRQPGFALADISLGLQTKDEKATLTFFVNNLTNHFYLTNAEDFFSSATGVLAGGNGNYVIGQPARDSHRYFGGRLSVKF